MKLLHTADWHVGKTIKGQSRLEEHRAVLADLVAVADAERPDVTLIVGDLYETGAPTPDAQALVLRTLLDLRETGTRVVVLAGNHDNAHALEAIRPVFAALDVDVIGLPRRPKDGGVLEIEGRSGDGLRLALLPFCSQRGVIRSAQLMDPDATAGEHVGTYAERMRQLILALCTDFGDDTVNVLATHCMVEGAKSGGGERAAQTFMDYWVSGTAFPPSAQYVALGHLHRTQQVGGAAPIWYSGSPLQVDFGEEEHDKHVLLVEAEPSTPARVKQEPITSGRRFRTLRGTLPELEAMADEVGDDYLRVFVTEPSRAGLAEDVRDVLGERVVDVRIDASVLETGGAKGSSGPDRSGASPQELFAAYLGERGIEDERIERLFARLLDEELH